MKIEVKSDKEGLKLTVGGDMTIGNIEKCKSSIIQAFTDVVDFGSDLTVDLNDIYEIDTAGLQVILLMKKEGDLRNVAIRFSAVSDVVKDIFLFCGMVDFFLFNIENKQLNKGGIQ